MKSLFERAEDLAQELYQQSFDYAIRNLKVALINVFSKEKFPEPTYKDTVSNEEYLEDVIQCMEVIHNEDLKQR